MGNEVAEWTNWLRDTVQQGLAARWDAENWERFRVNGATPTGTGGAAVMVPTQTVPMLSPLALVGGAVVLSAALYFLLRD